MSLRDKYTNEEWQKITEEVKDMKDFTPYGLLLKEIVYDYKDEAKNIEKQEQIRINLVEKNNLALEQFLNIQEEDMNFISEEAKQTVYEEGLKEMEQVIKDYGLDHSYLGGLGSEEKPKSEGTSQETVKKQLEQELKSQVKIPKEGQKLSKGKAPIAQLFKQFTLAFEQLAFRSQMGHEKYIATDADWMNWKKVPNAEFEFEQAKGRHSLKLGNEETDFEHLVAEAWNALALIQLKLEK